ncbi:zinc-binding dehydrogenase [Oceanobacillus polygoni]|uniref:L-iditol 2-dehydrogenase n=1 Tax=Oceanobacillus polygoni TaxID=1235259 RepID=A0A9X1CED6_9BACI|nr:zinc-binding dehydrogenase [Oceanobacillus polygoni]MBP2076108.1 L-iditol 2-dehydrogenase [Oceanobacillus polygoni]
MLPDSFRFGVLLESGKAEIREERLPDLKDDEVLIMQEACNICTTDYQQWQGKREHQGYPMAGGHECSGIIVAKGVKVSNSLKVGERVSVLYDYCGDCEKCKKGDITSCKNIKQFGKNYSDQYFGVFGFANYFIRKSKSVVKVSNDLSASEAGFVEPLSSVLKGIRKLRINSGFDTVVVIGGGTMGLLNAAAAQAMGARVIVSERNPKKVEKIKQMDLELIDAGETDPVEEVKKRTNGSGADIVIVAVGTSSANEQALNMIKDDEGKVLLFAAGYPAPELNVDSNEIHYKQCELIGTYGSSLEDFNNAAKMLSERRIDVSPLIEEEVPLTRIQEAYEKASTRGNYRISVLLQG